MPYQDPDTGETRFTLKEKQDWHNKQAKLGARKKSKKTGKVVNVSNFERGAHKAQADAIARKRYRYKLSRQKGNWIKPVKSVPSWYRSYEKDMYFKPKNFGSNESLESLKNYFK